MYVPNKKKSKDFKNVTKNKVFFEKHGEYGSKINSYI